MCPSQNRSEPVLRSAGSLYLPSGGNVFPTALGMIYSVNKLRHYLLGRKFTFHIDHSTLLYLVSKQSLTSKLARWTLLLQEFEFDIVHRPGVQHAVDLNQGNWLLVFGMTFQIHNYSE